MTLENLQSIEWCIPSLLHGGGIQCPACFKRFDKGHAEDCWLGNEIADRTEQAARNAVSEAPSEPAL